MTCRVERWYALKDRVKLRRGHVCEYCALRWGDHLHHRHYETRGQERECDVMLVCGVCHRAIHGYLPSIVVRNGSLADRGDTGRGMPPLWIAYLNGIDQRQAA